MPSRTPELHACPPDETLAALVDGKLTADEAAKLEAHVDSCDACHELLGSYAASYLVDPEYASTIPVGDRATALQRAAGLPIGTRVGRYVLVERVGEGASGVVYAAHDPELDRKIAIKVLHAKVDAQDRLLNEARAMAKLAHPNVVAVHDVGAFEGHVFVAMEFVAGGTLRAWMQDVHTTEEIIAAFVDAGRGLAAAHKAGLIHRDFKPENVLVGKDGRVRVTDFGLAARGRVDAGPVSGPESERNVAPGSDASLWTKAMAGTPAYMAPEQREGRVADARSDQYAFSVAFAEALHGSRPESPRDVLSPKGSTRRVPKRLAQILARGLEERPAARFPSMSSVLRAIEATRSRGRRWFALGVLALFAIVTFGVVRVLSARSHLCADAASGLKGVWDDDKRGAAKRAFDQSGAPNAAETWQRVSKTLDAYAARWTTSRTEACEATRIRGEQSDAMLGLRMQCLDRRRGELAALSDVLSRADTDVVEHAAFAASRLGPISACDDTAALSSALPLPEAKETRSRVDALRADLDRVRALESSGKFARALEGAHKDAVEAKTLGYRPIEAEALYLQGVLEAESGDDRAAVTTLNAAAFAAEAGRHDEVAAETWIALVEVLGSKLDRVGESDAAVQRAKAAAERLGPTSLPSLMLHDALGDRAQEFGRIAEAVTELRTAVDLEKKALGPRHLRVARSLSRLGSALRDDGDMEDALRAYDESLSIEEEVLGPMHPNVAITVQAIGVTLSRLGRYDEARAKYQRALSTRERVLGDDHPLVGETISSLVVAMRWSGAAAEALPLAERAAKIEEKAFGLDNDKTAGAINNVGYVEEALGHLPEARAAYERALAIREKLFGASASSVAISLGNLARVILAQGDAKTALAMYTRGLAIDDATLKPNHPDRAYMLVGLGKAHLASNDANAAVPLLERALALRESSHAAPRLLAESRFTLARALASRDRARSIALAKQAKADYAPLGPAFEKERADVDAFLR